MIVVDTSVGFKWLQEEDYSEKAISLLQNHKDNIETIIVPDIFIMEIANTLATKSQTTEKSIKQALNKLFDINLQTKSLNNEDIQESTLLAKKYTTAVYDMIFAVIAKRYKTILVTADENFKKKTRLSFVKHISEI